MAKTYYELRDGNLRIILSGTELHNLRLRVSRILTGARPINCDGEITKRHRNVPLIHVSACELKSQALDYQQGKNEKTLNPIRDGRNCCQAIREGR
jgi:hypothetical protein